MLWCETQNAAFFAYETQKAYVFRMEVVLEGDLPVFKWKPGKASITLEFVVEGLPNGANGLMRAKHRLTKFQSKLNDVVLPFTIENVSALVPEAQIDYDRWGRVHKTTATPKELPSSVPGLDPVRFPEMSYLPIEWPKEPSMKWTFSRTMGAGAMTFGVDGNQVEPAVFDFVASQSISHLENAQKVRVESREAAHYEVTSKIDASGTVLLGTDQRTVGQLRMKARTDCRWTAIAGKGAPFTRSYQTTVSVTRIP